MWMACDRRGVQPGYNRGNAIGQAPAPAAAPPLPSAVARTPWLSQEQAALRLDISRTQLSKIENMRSPYSQGLLEAAAEAYGCTVADLLIRDPSRPDAPWSIYETLKKAPEAQQRQISAVIETLLKTGS